MKTHRLLLAGALLMSAAGPLGAQRSAAAAAPTGISPVVPILKDLIETTGVSGHEQPVRDRIRTMIARLLPPGVNSTVDASGNLIVSLGPKAAQPAVLFIAHMDEIGWQVSGILPNGTLALQPQGAGITALFENHVALVHTARGTLPGSLYFVGAGPMERFPRLDLGMDRAAVLAAGVNLGDPVAVPKVYRPLLQGRATARSFDDRVGCAALVSAIGALRGVPLHERVDFVWSTGEELGLVGAAALAQTVHPKLVVALDTFVSSDSPLESTRFADAPLGAGFVVRAIDNSIITPRALRDHIVGLARAHHIPVQIGITGGGTDSSEFQAGGSQVLALGWPLRTSHAPGEVIDTRDVEALAAIIPVIARQE